MRPILRELLRVRFVLVVAVLAVAVLVVAAPAQQVRVVGPVIGGGVQFTTIQSAVDASRDGDIVLVRDGIYPAFSIVGKSISVVADGTTVEVLSTTGILVANVAAWQTVLLRGVTSRDALTPLHVRDCDGPVLVEDASFSSITTFGSSSMAVVTRCANVVFARCAMFGSSLRQGVTAGLAASDAQVSLFDCVVFGGAGGQQFEGLPAASVVGTRLVASGTTFRGGTGRDGIGFGTTCFRPPGDGADALVLVDAASSAWLTGCTLAPGAAGFGSPPCPGARPGAPIGGAGAAIVLPGPSAQLQVSGPTPAGASTTFTIQGPAHAHVRAELAAAVLQRELELLDDLVVVRDRFLGLGSERHPDRRDVHEQHHRVRPAVAPRGCCSAVAAPVGGDDRLGDRARRLLEQQRHAVGEADQARGLVGVGEQVSSASFLRRFFFFSSA